MLILGLSGDCLGKYLGIRIRINIEYPLEFVMTFIRRIGEDSITLLLAYERFPEFCYHYGIIGHSQEE